MAEEALQQQLRDELAKLNVTTLIIPRGRTIYVQVLDVSVNKIIKKYIEEFEDLHIDKNIENWKARKYSVGDRRLLMTYWVSQAWEKLHLKHKDTIIQTFVGLSLNPDGSKDSELKIKDLPNIEVGDYRMANSDSNLIVIDDDITVEEEQVQEESLLYTAQEVEEGINIENEADITTDLYDDSDERFDYNSDSDFDDDIDGDEVEGDCNMD